jgi:hypothetical protein
MEHIHAHVFFGLKNCLATCRTVFDSPNPLTHLQTDSIDEAIRCPVEDPVSSLFPCLGVQMLLFGMDRMGDCHGYSRN